MSTAEKIDTAIRSLSLGVEAIKTVYEALSSLADNDGEATEEQRESWRRRRAEIRQSLDGMLAEIEAAEAAEESGEPSGA